MSQILLVEALRYPFHQKRWKEKLLIAYVLHLFAWLVVPALPLHGYFYRMAREIIASGRAVLPEWDDWQGDFRRGLRWWGFLLLVTLPLTLIGVLWISALILMFTSTFTSSNTQEFPPAPLVFLPLAQMVIFPLTIVYGLALLFFAPPALLHIAVQDRFSAAFDIRGWWAVFRANWEGFLLASLIVLALLLTFNYLTQALFWLTCLFGLFLHPAVYLYLALVGIYLFAHAYRNGLEELSGNGSHPQTVSHGVES